jgi:hypothetical protein
VSVQNAAPSVQVGLGNSFRGNDVVTLHQMWFPRKLLYEGSRT